MNNMHGHFIYNKNPDNSFLSNLKDSIHAHQEKGDRIILRMDLNDPVQRHDIRFFFDELNMKEAILSTYREQNPPATNILKESQYSIDFIWHTIELTAIKAGYSNFREGIPSDHRVFRVKFLLRDVFGTADKITKRVSMLKASDPRKVKKYIHRIKT